MKYLFIAGCARSGTSALTHLIGSHKTVILGMERYGHLVSPNDFRLKREHFDQDRFYNIQPGDTFYSSFEKFHGWDPRIRSKFGYHEYIGDKRPELYEVYDKLNEEFSPTIFFIYRNIVDVAASWNDRAAKNEGWPTHKDFTKAIHAWTSSIRLTIDAINKGVKIFPINYERLFLEKASIRPIFDKLGLEIDDAVKEKHQNILANSDRLVIERTERALCNDQKRYVEENCNTKLGDKLDSYQII